VFSFLWNRIGPAAVQVVIGTWSASGPEAAANDRSGMARRGVPDRSFATYQFATGLLRMLDQSELDASLLEDSVHQRFAL
jgi:hypothetical protein